MASIKPVLLVLSCLIVLNSSLLHGKDLGREGLEETQQKCTPGKFYRKGCRRCFCDENARPVCTPHKNCKLAGQLPSSPDSIKVYSEDSLQKLTSLPHQAANCTPGATYRVDCNTCLCLANENLLCTDVLCPSWEEVNRIKAQRMTGKSCTSEKADADCIECTCTESKLKCKPKPKCSPDNRRHVPDIAPLNLANDLPAQGVKCKPGMVYMRDCNRCYCHNDHAISCTLMYCLKHTEVERLKKLRLTLEKEGN